MAENDNSGCLSWIIILVIAGLIASGVEKCSSNHHKRQEIILPSYSSFKMNDGDPKIYFQTFDSQTMACLNFFWESGQTSSMYVSIEDGNDLYDSDNSHCGYIVVNKNGSFNIRGWDIANGHYVGLEGAKMSYKGKKEDIKEKTMDFPSWLNGEWREKYTPLGEAVIIIDGNTIKENIGGEVNSGTFQVGTDYIKVKYGKGGGVRYDMDVENERIGLGEGCWLTKVPGRDEDKTSHVLDDVRLESAKQSFLLIPDHSKVSEKAAEYMTKDLYDALVAAWDVPIWVDGEIGNEEFLFYFVTGNGGAAVGPITSVMVASEEKDRCVIELKYAEDWGEGFIAPELTTISLIMVNEGGKWLLDDFKGGIKEECKEYIISEVYDFRSGKIRQHMKENQKDDFYTDEHIAQVDRSFCEYISNYENYLESINRDKDPVPFEL